MPALPTPEGLKELGSPPCTVGQDLWVLAKGWWRGLVPRDGQRLLLSTEGLPVEWEGVQAAPPPPLALPPLPCSPLREVQHYGISREDVTLGRILGEGFFGEVYEGIYTTPVSVLPSPCPACLPRARGEGGKAAPTPPSPSRKGSGSTWL